MITSHVLDTAKGKPAAGIHVELQVKGEKDNEWSQVGNATTNNDRRVSDLLVWEPRF